MNRSSYCLDQMECVLDHIKPLTSSHAKQMQPCMMTACHKS